MGYFVLSYMDGCWLCILDCGWVNGWSQCQGYDSGGCFFLLLILL